MRKSLLKTILKQTHHNGNVFKVFISFVSFRRRGQQNIRFSADRVEVVAVYGLDEHVAQA